MKISWAGQITRLIETTLQPVNTTLDYFKDYGHTRNRNVRAER